MQLPPPPPDKNPVELQYSELIIKANHTQKQNKRDLWYRIHKYQNRFQYSATKKDEHKPITHSIGL